MCAHELANGVCRMLGKWQTPRAIMEWRTDACAHARPPDEGPRHPQTHSWEKPCLCTWQSAGLISSIYLCMAICWIDRFDTSLAEPPHCMLPAVWLAESLACRDPDFDCLLYWTAAPTPHAWPPRGRPAHPVRGRLLHLSAARQQPPHYAVSARGPSQKLPTAVCFVL